jgi:AraC-like DNA-binding protein
MAASPRLSRIEPLDYLVSTATNLYQAVELFNNYQFMVHPFARFRIVAYEKEVTVYYTPDNDMAKHRHYLELFLGSMLTFGRVLTGWNITPLQTTFHYTKPNYAKCYEDFFRSPLVFNADYSGMTFQRDDFSRLLVCADEKRNQWAESQVKRLISQTDSFTEKVSQLILNDPQPGMISMNSMADRLQISRRTLHRKLVESGTSFNRVRDTVLFQKAKRLMADPQNSLQQVADQTGFSELSAFHRAFKRWSGFVPSQYRKRLEILSLGNHRKFNSR